MREEEEAAEGSTFANRNVSGAAVPCVQIEKETWEDGRDPHRKKKKKGRQQGGSSLSGGETHPVSHQGPEKGRWV